jgi:uncharacterized protein YjlB
MDTTDVKTFKFEDDGMIPNNPVLPVLLYVGALRGKTGQTEKIFNSHNWLGSWTNGVFDYHHYHSNTHEVLGVISGSAVLQLGGGDGKQVSVQKGDVIVLPAGTGHKRLSSSDDFQVVGAYPAGMDYNMHKGEAGERPRVLEEIKRVPIPETDPVYGKEGPLIQLWNRSAAG